jgi:hypothetical protein
MTNIFKYETTYLTVSGRYSLQARTLQEAKADAARLKTLNEQPYHLATNIKISKVYK